MDSLYVGPFRVSQLLAAVTCFAAATVLVVMMFRKHEKENLFVNVVAAREAAAAQEAEAPAEEALAEEAPAEDALAEETPLKETPEE